MGDRTQLDERLRFTEKHVWDDLSASFCNKMKTGYVASVCVCGGELAEETVAQAWSGVSWKILPQIDLQVQCHHYKK